MKFLREFQSFTSMLLFVTLFLPHLAHIKNPSMIPHLIKFVRVFTDFKILPILSSRVCRWSGTALSQMLDRWHIPWGGRFQE